MRSLPRTNGDIAYAPGCRSFLWGGSAASPSVVTRTGGSPYASFPEKGMGFTEASASNVHLALPIPSSRARLAIQAHSVPEADGATVFRATGFLSMAYVSLASLPAMVRRGTWRRKYSAVVTRPGASTVWGLGGNAKKRTEGAHAASSRGNGFLGRAGAWMQGLTCSINRGRK